jgi:molybdopterin-binding protein
MKQCLIVCAVLFLLLSGSTASAQIAADLRGRVLDASGAVVANATVELTNSDTNTHLITRTSAAGHYVFTNLNPGSYQLDVTASGFEHLTRTGITAIVGQTVAADLTLTVGGNQQTVKVSADAPLLQSETSNVETNIAGPTVVSMPLNTRNFVQLATLAPGVALPPGTLLPRINLNHSNNSRATGDFHRSVAHLRPNHNGCSQRGNRSPGISP